MKIEVKYFARVREELACAGEQINLPPDVQTVAQLRAFLMARGGAWATVFGEGQLIRHAYNFQMCDDQQKLTDACELAFFPPVTGG